MRDDELFKIILSNTDISKILRDNLEITKKDIEKFTDKVKKYLHKESKTYKHLNLYIDGAARGNPGESGIGMVIEDDKGNVLKEYCEYIGINTNNTAEYRALILGLEKAKMLKPLNLKIYSDSQLLVNQIKGTYKVRNSRLVELYWKSVNLLRDFKSWEIISISRKKNKKADILANLGIDKK